MICKEKEDPASAHDCANQMVAAGVVGVLVPVTSQGDAMVPTITGAGVPYVTVVGPSAREMTTPDSFVLTGGLPSSFTGTAAYSAKHGYKRVALLVEDAGSVLAGVRLLAGPAWWPAANRCRLAARSCSGRWGDRRARSGSPRRPWLAQ